MAKTLKIWNGRGYCCHKSSDPLWSGIPPSAYSHAYVAAYSRADARRVIAEYTGREPHDAEIRDYWSEGAWGNDMKGITPERGLWVAIGRASPVRVI